MRRAAFAAVALSLAFAAPAWAAGDGQPPTGQTPNFDERKAETLKRIDAQMSRLQEAKDCIQAAKKPDEMKACREKRMAEGKEVRKGMEKKGRRSGQQRQ